MAEEISNVLMGTRSMDVRPTASTRKYSAADVDPQQAGRQLRVSTVLTGTYRVQGKRLFVNIEASDVNTNRLIWHDALNVPADDLISMKTQLAAKMRQGLLPQLGAADGFVEGGTKPKDQDAYDLYLRSLAISRDPDPNKSAIAILEDAVKRDPNYAPYWGALGLRYYYLGAYSNGGEATFKRSDEAYRRALSLDPNLNSASALLVLHMAERGDTKAAYEQGQELVRRRPESAESHFALSYALRYAGMLPQSTQQCDIAWALDSGNFEFRSCAWAFLESGKPERALDFIRLDSGSEWADYLTVSALVREGKIDQARIAVKKGSANPFEHRELLEACLQPTPPANLDSIAQSVEASVATEPDPERRYYLGAIFAYCGKTEAATRLIKSAIDQNYCGVSALQFDPLLAKLRSTRSFSELQAAAQKCQTKFLESVKQPAGR